MSVSNHHETILQTMLSSGIFLVEFRIKPFVS